MRKITLILAEAAIELVPNELASGRDVVSWARRRGKRPEETILDISLHYRSMKKLRDWHKRGRPDIIHTTLLVATSSLLWRRGFVRVVLDTRHGLVFFREDIRLTKNYNRFIGLMEQVFVSGSAPPNTDKPLIWVVKKDLYQFLEEERFDSVYILHEKGSRVSPRELAREIVSKESIGLIVGGFQRGDFSEKILSLPYPKISIADEVLDTWAVVCRIFSSIEDILFNQ